MVLRSPQPGRYEALARDGPVAFSRVEGDQETPGYVVDRVEGRNPLADQAVDRFVGVGTSGTTASRARRANSYPFAFDTVAQLFDHPAAPDLCVVHAAAHNWEDQGGHRGEHGSLDVIQARAPFVIAGRGVQPARAWSTAPAG